MQVRFLPNDITVPAEAGEPLLKVAARAGIAIPTGCLMGSCHACEVDLDLQGDTVAVCACITAVPAGMEEVAVNLYSDPTW